MDADWSDCWPELFRIGGKDSDSDSEDEGEIDPEYSDESISQASEHPDSRFVSDFSEMERLGKGSYGKVFKCTHNLDKKNYAVKRIPRKANEGVPMEVVVLSGLYHPNIVRYHQAWTEDYIKTGDTTETSGSDDSSGNADYVEYLYIQMELCNDSLEKYLEDLKEDVKVEKKLAWNLFLELVEAVALVHSKGFVHCDLCPRNVLLDIDGHIRICDFGLVQSLGQTMSTEYLGITEYRAPELRNVVSTEAVVTDKVDIYSIGIFVVDLFHSNCCGQERYPVITSLQDTKKLPPSLHDECPIVHDMLGRLLSQNADERPSAKELFEALKWKKDCD